MRGLPQTASNPTYLNGMCSLPPFEKKRGGSLRGMEEDFKKKSPLNPSFSKRGTE